MKSKIMRALAAGSIAAGALGVALVTAAPASAHLCNNEAMPGDVWISVGSTAGAGADTGTTGLRYVPVACVQVGQTTYGVGTGATITPTPSGYHIQPYLCDAHTCNTFLIAVG